MLNIKNIIANHRAGKLRYEPDKKKRISGIKNIESKFGINFKKSFRRDIIKGANNRNNGCILDYS